jgi:hypothetical protein
LDLITGKTLENRELICQGGPRCPQQYRDSELGTDRHNWKGRRGKEALTPTHQTSRNLIQRAFSLNNTIRYLNRTWSFVSPDSFLTERKQAGCWLCSPPIGVGLGLQ